MTKVGTPQAPPDLQALQHVFQVGTGFIASAALGVAVKLGIPDQLSDGPRTAADLARAVGANEDALYRTLRALAAVGIFDETAPRRFGLTAAGAWLRSGIPGGPREMVNWLCDAFHLRIYAELEHGVRTGETVGEKVTGRPVFEHLAADQELSGRFNDAMTAFSATVAPAMLKAYDFSGIGTIADIAGGHGMILASILRQYPAMRGILFDLEHVLAGNRLAEFGVKDRVRLASGDFFEAVPAGADAYIMKHIIHDWDDAHCVRILTNCRKAVAPGGKVLIVDQVVTDGPESVFAKLSDLEMLVMTTGGRERTAAEFGAVLAAAGLTLTRIVPTESPVAVIESVAA